MTEKQPKTTSKASYKANIKASRYKSTINYDKHLLRYFALDRKKQNTLHYNICIMDRNI